jgi:xanthine dehydrogenase YagR molybdenum-binding subunit
MTADAPGGARTTFVGRPLPRVDGRRKVTGAATYAAEFRPRELVHAALVRATIASGRVVAIDAARALAAPGVLAVITHENAPPLADLPERGVFRPEDRMPLSDDRVHYAGQHVALVVAKSFEQARHAAALVRIDYAEEPPALPDGRTLAAPAEPSSDAGDHHRRGEIDAALARPVAARVEHTYTTPVETHHPIEPSATIAVWDDGRLQVWDATQWVGGTQRALAAVFGLDLQDVRVICPFVGGGFGAKGAAWPHTTLAAVAAREVGRPVKLVLTRAEMSSASGHRPPTSQALTLAADEDGRLLALRHRSINVTSVTTEYVESCGHSTSRTLYACDNVEVTHAVVRANVPPPTFMRAPGECSGTFALECAMDELAVALGIDPVQLRLRNHADADPASGRPWSGKRLRACYEHGADAFGWAARDPAPGSMREGGDLVGWGMATAVYPAYRSPASAEVAVGRDGRAVVRAATHELGTGAYTIFTQVAADALGIAPERITFELGDSALPRAPVAAGSCTAASVSDAIIAAAEEVRAALASGAEDARAVGRAAPDAELAGTYAMSSFGAHFCEVRIDPAEARVRVSRIVSVMDVGRVLNPRTGRAQIVGGVIMGIGMALTEETLRDPRSGRPVNADLAGYAIPVNADVGTIEVAFIDEPDPHINSLGARGIGEIGITGVAAAVANAVHHATGLRVRDLPITPERLLAAGLPPA